MPFKANEIFKAIRFLGIFLRIFPENKVFLLQVYEIFTSDTPLARVFSNGMVPIDTVMLCQCALHWELGWFGK